MSDNKPVKTIMDASTLTSLTAGIGLVSEKVLKQKLTEDPSNVFMNFVKFTAVMTGSIYLKNYLEKEKILPDN